MRKSFTIIGGALVCALYSCSPSVTSNIIHNYHPLETVDEVVVIGEEEKLPGDAEWIGSAKVDGKADYDQMASLTRLEAWKYGAKYVKIKSFTAYGQNSRMHIMNSNLYRSDLVDNTLNLNDHVDYQTPEISEAISTSITPFNTEVKPFYLLIVGNLESSKVSGGADASQNVINLSFGAGCFVTKSLSVELGVQYSRETVDYDKTGGLSYGNGIMSALVYHRKISERFYYIPQLDLGYVYINSKLDEARFKYEAVCASLIPLAFEYRSQDNQWGFQAGLGEFGLIFPQSGNKNQDYVFSLNQVSIGVVKYF